MREDAILAAQKENAREVELAAKEAFCKGKQSKLTQIQQALVEANSEVEMVKSEAQRRESKAREEERKAWEAEKRKLKSGVDKVNRNTEKLVAQAKTNQKIIGNGSAQYNGLSQEEFIVEVVRERFGDKVDQSGIGENGADILQTVWREEENYGTIYYESKSTSKGFK